MLKTIVKVGNVSNLSVARYGAGMGVEMLGFNFNTNSTHYVTPEKYKDIVGWVAGVKTVGECHGLTFDEIKNKLNDYKVDFLEIDHDTYSVFELEIPLIFRIYWEESEGEKRFEHLETLFKELKPYVSYFLIESDMISLSQKVHHALKRWAQEYPILLGFCIEAESVNDLLIDTHLKGISLKSDLEEKVGFTNTVDLDDILTSLELD